MHSVRRRRLMVIMFVLIVLSSVAGLILYAFRQNISLFYTPSEISIKHAPFNHLIRLGGMVKKGSIQRSQDGLNVSFVLTDYKDEIKVSYQGILPDLFREEQGIVAEGVLKENGGFTASTVLAKHDANYMPPQLKDAMATSKGQP